MNPKELLMEAAALQPQLQAIRRDLHQHPELGFDLPYTKALVRSKLEEMGYQPKEVGKSGLAALVGGKKPGKCVLLRADMDALPMQEVSGEEFSSLNDGKMHACGHDLHTAMLLGAAKLLKAHEDELEGTVKLEFQPAEEIFQGSLDMLANGILEDPHVDAAVMMHVAAGLPMPAGLVMIPAPGVSMASCEQYHITVTGKGGHGSTPHLAIDPITAAAHIHIALQEINSRELDPYDFGVFTTCRFEAGTTSNVIPNSAEMWGTIRTITPDNKVGEKIKARMTEICKGLGAAYRCEVAVDFFDYCPCMVINADLAKEGVTYMTELLGRGALDMSLMSDGKPGGGSEDFSYMSHHVPTLSLFLAAGNSKEGYTFAQHNPQVRFDDKALCSGASAYAYMALRWLSDHA